MIDLKQLQSLLARTPEEKDYPKHVVVNLVPSQIENFEKVLPVFDMLLEVQKENNIPILTVSLGKKENLDQKKLMRYCERLLKAASADKMNVTIFGRWYDLSGELVEALKVLNNETNDFDHYFTNICINYEPQQEIADSCKVFIKKVLAEKEDPEKVTAEKLKENIYSSYFIPVDLVIESGSRFQGTFLWDSAGSKIVFLRKKPHEIVKQDILRAIQSY